MILFVIYYHRRNIVIPNHPKSFQENVVGSFFLVLALVPIRNDIILIK